MKQPTKESASRSITKSISYRILSISADTLAAYIFTKSITETAGIVLVVNSYSTILYYLHERVWAHIHWYKKPVVQSPVV